MGNGPDSRRSGNTPPDVDLDATIDLNKTIERPGSPETNTEYKIPAYISPLTRLGLENLYGVVEPPAGQSLQVFLREQLKAEIETFQENARREGKPVPSAAEIAEEMLAPYSEEEARATIQQWIDSAGTEQGKRQLREASSGFFAQVAIETPPPALSREDSGPTPEAPAPAVDEAAVEPAPNDQNREQAPQPSSLDLEPERENSSPESKEFITPKFIPINSRLYHEFAGEYFDDERLQERFETVDEYLHACYADLARTEGHRGRKSEWPAGCETAEDLLKPFWETQSVHVRVRSEKGEHLVPVATSSMFALEHGLQYVAARPVGLAHHVYGSRRGRKVSKLEDLQEVSAKDLYKDYSQFLQTTARTAAESRPDLFGDAYDYAVQTAGEGATPQQLKEAAMERAFRPQNEGEIRSWFEEKLEELKEAYRDENSEDSEADVEAGAQAKYIAAGYGELESYYFSKSGTQEYLPEDTEGEVGGREDFETYEKIRAARKERDDAQRAAWVEAEKARRAVLDEQGKDLGPAEVDVSPEAIAKFYERSGGRGPVINVYEGKRSFVKNEEFNVIGRYRQVELKYDSDQVVRDTVKTRDGLHVAANLPKEAPLDTNNQDQMASYAAILRKIVEQNEGKRDPVVFYRDGKVCIGLGDRDKNPTALLEFSGYQLLDLRPDLQNAIRGYLDNKAKRGFIPAEEFDAMRTLERQLLNTQVDLRDGEAVSSLAQKAWDMAFKQEWIKAIGIDEYNRLQQEYERKSASVSIAGPSVEPPVTVIKPTRPDETAPAEKRKPHERNEQKPLKPEDSRFYEKRRWAMDPEVLKSAEFEAKAEKFNKYLAEKYDNWEHFLEHGYAVIQAAEFCGLRTAQAYHLMGEWMLNRPGREKEYKEFQNLLAMTTGELDEYLTRRIPALQDIPKEEKNNKSRLIRFYLRQAIYENPFPSDEWAGGEEHHRTEPPAPPVFRRAPDRTQAEPVRNRQSHQVRQKLRNLEFVDKDLLGKVKQDYREELGRLVDTSLAEDPLNIDFEDL